MDVREPTLNPKPQTDNFANLMGFTRLSIPQSLLAPQEDAKRTKKSPTKSTNTNTDRKKRNNKKRNKNNEKYYQ